MTTGDMTDLEIVAALLEDVRALLIEITLRMRGVWPPKRSVVAVSPPSGVTDDSGSAGAPSMDSGGPDG